MASRRFPLSGYPRLLLVVTFLTQAGCIMAVMPEPADSRIIITDVSHKSLEGVRKAMAEFSAKYDYEMSTPWHYPPVLAQTDYKARLGFWGLSDAPSFRERPLYVSVFRRDDGAIVVSYQGQGDVRANANPVVNDLKRLLARNTRGEHIVYSYTPSHWRLTGMGD